MSNKKSIPNTASKKTHESIQFFKGNRKAVDLLEDDNGRKKLKISNAAGRTQKKIIDFSISHEYIVLALLVVAVSALALWFIVGSRGQHETKHFNITSFSGDVFTWRCNDVYRALV